MPHSTHDHQKERRDAKRYHPVDDDAVAIIEKALLPVQNKCQHCTALFFGEICHVCKTRRWTGEET